MLNKCDKPMKRLWISSMEDTAIRKGFETLKDGSAYDNLYASALCRSKADWLVGINATRLFSVLYHRTLNVGRVVSPTLALIVQREAEIDAFKPEPFYTVMLGLPGFDAGSERMKSKTDAETLCQSCANQSVVGTKLEHRDKAEKPPALYDLTTLQRDANRILGFTAQQTLDYLQSLYEKKLCTYPRTDSRYLTSDMADGLPELVSNAAAAMPKVGSVPIHVNAAQVINDKRVSDHHAVIPTANLNENALVGLPAGERAVLELVALRLLCAVAQSHEYTETAVTLECAGHSFSAKGRTVTSPGWRALMEAYHSGKSENESADAAKALPPMDDGQTFTVNSAAVKEGKTTPPKHYTEDTLLSAMEVAGAKEMPEDAERKGLGTPATRAAILEKLVATGFVERKKSKKVVNLIPTHAGVSLITVLPEQLQSPLMTAEWEHRLKEIERGEESPETFMQGIRDMVCELVKTYKTVLGADVLFPSGRTVVGKCPRCGSDVTESKKGYFCERNDCHFGLWRDNRFLAAKKINLTKKMAEALLKDGKTYASGIFSEKTGKTYDAYIVLEDDGQRSAYKLEFSKESRK
jgi:DNA topoisomerase-3